MLSVYKKNLTEIEDEKELYKYYNIEGIKHEVCPTYVLAKDGTKVDVVDLQEDQIIGLYRSALKEFIIARANGEIDKSGKIECISDAFKLTEGLKGRKIISYTGVKSLYEFFTPDFLKEYDMPMMGFILTSRDEEEYQNLARQILLPLIKEKMEKVDLIARYIKESSNDFVSVFPCEKMKVLDQLSLNEKNRERILGKEYQ